MALAKEKVAQIQVLLQEGATSKREISRITGVSRVTIDKIESKLLFPEDNEPQVRILHFSEADRVLADDLKPEFARCTGCGGMQQKGIPCQVCKLRRRMMEDYDCYMRELLTPSIVFSPLQSNKEQTNGRSKKPRKKRTRRKANPLLRGAV